MKIRMLIKAAALFTLLTASFMPVASSALASPTPTLLAQNDSPISCRSGESTFVATETQNFWVFICGGDNPGTYLGVDKSNPRSFIRVPLRDYDRQGNYFEAVNGDFTYILSKTPRGMFLTVSQGTRELLREPVLQPW